MLTVCRSTNTATLDAATFACLRQFIAPGQMAAIQHAMRGAEGAFFVGKMIEYAERIASMPKTYETKGKGDEAVAHLHYFTGGCDWYITEKDCEDAQHQAFGLACIHESELGYINRPLKIAIARSSFAISHTGPVLDSTMLSMELTTVDTINTNPIASNTPAEMIRRRNQPRIALTFRGGISQMVFNVACNWANTDVAPIRTTTTPTALAIDPTCSRLLTLSRIAIAARRASSPAKAAS
jgi:hypothetical protein